jgi:hypothetical protein
MRSCGVGDFRIRESVRIFVVGFSDRHRRALVVLLTALLGYGLVQLARNPSHVDDPQPIAAARALELADRIDPNTADVPTLAALPGVGLKRAAEIVRFRDEFVRSNPGEKAFRRPQDLLKIKGFGYAMMSQLSPYLLLEENPPTTRPD